MKLFDTHAHYNDRRFVSEYDGGGEKAISDVLASYPIGWILNAGTNAKTTLECIALAEKFDVLYASSGLHPSDTRFFDNVNEEIDKLEPFLSHPKCVAVGEIGLDYHYPDTDKIRQHEFFDAQMSLAEKHSLPVIIHDRDAHEDCFDMVKAHPNVTGVFHSCSESAETVKELVKRGWYISFSGTVTFKNADNVRKSAAAVPHDRILVETDCPYLAPHPYRGKLNHSGYMVKTAEVTAEVLGLDYEEFAEISTMNAMRLFGINPGTAR